MRRTLFVFALVLSAATAASAATVPFRTDGQLIAIADRVVRARVLDSVVERAPSGTIRTRTRLAVLEDFTGGSEPELTVYELGGRLPDGRELWLPGVPRFARGDEVVLCLERVADGYRTVSLGFSAFHVEDAVGGRRLARFGGVGIVGGAAVPLAAPDARGLDEFRRVAATVKGVAARAVLSDAQAFAAVAAVGPVVEPFTLLGDGIRWPEADSGTPVQWYRNTLTPSPIQNGDTDTEIRTALEAWTAPTSASIILTFAGTRQAPLGTVGDPYCTADNLGAGLITFGDPLDDIGPGVLAIGGGCLDGTTHVLNGRTFDRFSHALVVLNDTLTGFTTPPNITRILEHEVGHAIGLGHSDMGAVNIMHPSCCQDLTPLPPAIGADDRAGLEFLYPIPVVPGCTFTLAPPTTTIGPVGGIASITVTPSRTDCPWAATSNTAWIAVIEGASGVGAGVVRIAVRSHVTESGARSGTVTIGTATATVVQTALQDSDGDSLPDDWESVFGLDPASALGPNGQGGDPDGDGATNLQELVAGTHPRGFHRRYLAEGVSNAFFDTELAIFKTRAEPAAVVVRIQPQTGSELSWLMAMPLGVSRRTLPPGLLESLTTTPFSTLVESDWPVVVDRTMRWDAAGYGSHAETALETPSTTWYLAEGSTSGPFSLFYLLQNPGDAAATATVRFLRPAPLPPIDRQYAIAPRSRLTIPVDGIAPELASTDLSAVITASQPIIVERAMYLDRPGQPFAAGHESAGVTAPALEWFMAEGATGSFFDLFLLIENPGVQTAVVQVDYLLSGGGTLSKQYAVAAQSRFTIYVDDEQIPAGSGQRPLASTAVATRVRSMNVVPIIVERAMWWPQPAWYEAHNAAGTTTTGTGWAMAAGAVGGSTSSETYVLIANTSDRAGRASVILAFEDNDTSTVSEVALPAQSRTSVAVSTLFPMAAGRQFGIMVVSLDPNPVPIVVERAMYESPGGVTWAAGTDAVATRIQP